MTAAAPPPSPFAHAPESGLAGFGLRQRRRSASRSLTFRVLLFCLSLSALFPALSPAPANAAEPDAQTRAAIAAALERRTEASRLADRVAGLVDKGHYQQAEDLLSGLLDSRQTAEDGQRLLEKVYFQLAGLDRVQSWNRWCDQRPASHFPLTIRGIHYYERVRFLDGANQTLLLSDRQRREFTVSLRRAQADLEQAAALNPRAPGPAAALTGLALHLGQPRAEMERWFAAAVAIDPGWLETYRAKLLYLAPWWHGSTQMMAQFADWCLDNRQPGSTSYMVALDYFTLSAERQGSARQAGQFLLTPGVYRSYVRALDRYIGDYPRSERIGMYLALEEGLLDQPYVAIAAHTDTLGQDPGRSEARRGRVLAYFRTRQLAEAEEDLREMERLDGVTSFTRAALGEIAFVRDRNSTLGHQLFDQAVALSDSSYRRTRHMWRRAELYRALGRHLQALTDYSAALREDVLFEEAYFGRAQSKHAMGDVDGALADLVILKSEIRGQFSVRARSLINTYLRTDYRAPGESPQASTVPANPDDSPPADTLREDADNAYRDYLVRGLRSYYQGQVDQARQDFHRVIGHHPADPKPYFMLGEIAATRQFDQARACIYYREAHRRSPRTPDYLIAAARCLYRERNFSPVIDMLSDYLAADDTPVMEQRVRAQIYFLRGLCLDEIGLLPEALQDMRQALELDPSLRAAELYCRDHDGAAPRRPEAERADAAPPPAAAAAELAAAVERLNEAGREKLQAGDVGGAKVAFLKAVRLDPEADLAYYHLGRLYFEHEHNYEKARLYYSQAIDRNDRIARYHFDRAVIHFYFKQYGPARDDFTTALELQPTDLRSLYYRALCNHYLSRVEAARRDFDALRQADQSWTIEIERFRNAWRTEVEQFLQHSD